MVLELQLYVYTITKLHAFFYAFFLPRLFFLPRPPDLPPTVGGSSVENLGDSTVWQ